MDTVEIAEVTMKGDPNAGKDPSLSDEPPAPAAIEEPKEDVPFTWVEQMPTFPDGQDAMYKYIYEKIKYPAIARENGISGQVIVQFVVSRDGDILNAKIVRGLGGGLSEEALRVVNGMPRWKPGKHNGKAVPVTFTLPIKFVLQ
ncbi:MAG TPA: energy transducer TonB [Saprospiraceae bacterium]|nr:energy transducer TonB [Saprospiraceae bacterium]